MDRSGNRVGLDASSTFEQLVEAAPDAIVGVDESGRIVLVNGQTEELFGYTRGELVGEQVEALVPERFRDTHPRHRANYFEEPRTRPMGAGIELFAERKDGTEFPIPDLLANAGGVTVSYFEWAQDLQRYSWNADEIATRLRSVYP